MPMQHFNKSGIWTASTKDRERRLAYVSFLNLRHFRYLPKDTSLKLMIFFLGIILNNAFKCTFLPPCKENYAWKVCGDRHGLKTSSWKTATSCDEQRQHRKAETLSSWNSDCHQTEWPLLGITEDWSKKMYFKCEGSHGKAKIFTKSLCWPPENL